MNPKLFCLLSTIWWLHFKVALLIAAVLSVVQYVLCSCGEHVNQTTQMCWLKEKKHPAAGLALSHWSFKKKSMVKQFSSHLTVLTLLVVPTYQCSSPGKQGWDYLPDFHLQQMSQAQHSYLCYLASPYYWNMISPQLHWQFLLGGLHVSTHMHVCIGGVPHALLFSSESWEEGMSASQLSSVMRVIEVRRGSSLFAFANILPSVTRGQSVRVCVCVCILGLERGSHNGAPLCPHPFWPLMHI